MITLILAALIALGPVVWLWLIAPARGDNHARMRHLLTYRYAHRGLHNTRPVPAPAGVPENSLAAFIAARDTGLGMELDVTLSADGDVVVFHDDTLMRACGIDEPVHTHPAAFLTQCPLFGTDHRIPRFDAVLQEINGAVPLIVELKDCPNRLLLCQRVAELLDHYTGAYCIESFHPAIVRWFRRNRPEVIRGQLSAGPAAFPEQSPGERFLLSRLLVNVAGRPHFIAYHHEDAFSSPEGAKPQLLLRVTRWLGAVLIGWTVSEPAALPRGEAFFDALIVEHLPGLGGTNA